MKKISILLLFVALLTACARERVVPHTEDFDKIETIPYLSCTYQTSYEISNIIGEDNISMNYDYLAHVFQGESFIIHQKIMSTIGFYYN